MISSTETAQTSIDEIKERFQHLTASRPAKQLTLYDLLEPLSLNTFKKLLTDAGLVDLLKQRSKITVIAPIDEAFETMSPHVRVELDGERGLERLQTLARGHIITYSSLFKNPLFDCIDIARLQESPNTPEYEPLFDMNGSVLDIDAQGTVERDRPLFKDGGYRRVFVHQINGVRPMEALPSGFIKVSNGSIIFVPKLVVSKAFLDQKYQDRIQMWWETDPDRQQTTWEVLNVLGLKKFSKLIERAGLIDKLNIAPTNKADKIAVFAPIDEAFDRVDERLLNDFPLSHLSAEKLAKNHITDIKTTTDWHTNKFVYSPKYALWSAAPKLETASGKLFLYTRCLTRDREANRWLLQPVPWPEQGT